MPVSETEISISTVHRRGMRLMGNRFEISVVGDDESYAHQCIDKAVTEISRIEKLLTTFSDDSQTNEIKPQMQV